MVSAKGQSQLRRSDEDSLEVAEEALGEEDMAVSVIKLKTCSASEIHRLGHGGCAGLSV